MNNLYVIVIDWGHFDETKEAEWLHVVSDKPDYEKFKELAIKHLVENVEVEREDVEIDSLWINEVKEVDGYIVRLEKE